MKILMVLTSLGKLGATGKPTGFWLEAFAAPYYAFKDAGAAVTLASPRGGQPPLDPKSEEPGSQTDATRRFKADPVAQAILASTRRLADVLVGDFDAVFSPGDHGPRWDLAEDAISIARIEAMLLEGKPVADGLVITGHNPASSESAALALLARLKGTATPKPGSRTMAEVN